MNKCPKPCTTRFSTSFEYYKDLEEGKWVKIVGWAGVDEAKAIIQRTIEAENKA